MPILAIPAVAVFIRVMIQAITSGAFLIVLEKLLSPLIDLAKSAVANFYGVTDDEAEDLLANEVIDALATVGILALTIRSKLPTKIAEKLGFTIKGYSKRGLSPRVTTKVPPKTTTTTIPAGNTALEVSIAAQALPKLSAGNVQMAQSLFNNILKGVGITTAFFFAAAQYIDFANWEGPYQGTFQKILGFLGLEVDKPNPKARTISNDTWTKIYAVIEELNPETIAFPWEGTVRPYSRANLADAVDHFAANLAADGTATTFKEIFGLLLPTIKIRGKGATNVSPTYSTQTSVTVIQPPRVQVFSGIVSQGVLGQSATFQARTNDMIDDMQELVESASVNLASYLVALPSRVTYEVKIVSSVTTKDGFTQRGTSTQILSSYNKDGTPRYKTITNKFAVLYLYMTSEKGTRTKLATINIGPVNSAKFLVNQDNLNTLATNLQQVVTTNNINNIASVATGQPITIQAPVTNSATIIPPVIPSIDQSSGLIKGQTLAWWNNLYTTYSQKGNAENWAYFWIGVDGNTAQQRFYRKENGSWVEKATYAEAQAPFTAGAVATPAYVPPVTTNSSSTATRILFPNATTLAEWWAADGSSLPSVSDRSILYERYGLGARSLYVGTAEQNTRLLRKLQGY